MTTPTAHIIVGAGHRCLCGLYHVGTEDRKAVYCQDVLNAASDILDKGPEAQLIHAVLIELVEFR